MRVDFIMAYNNNTIQMQKYKHLSSFERGEIAALHKDSHSNREIARRLGRVHQTIAAGQQVSLRPAGSHLRLTILK